jgi:ribose transport system substrate-binding protein
MNWPQFGDVGVVVFHGFQEERVKKLRLVKRTGPDSPRRTARVLSRGVVIAALVLTFASPYAAQGAPVQGPKQLINRLPANLRALYIHTTDPIKPSAYSRSSAKKRPWKFCFADSYEGNAWRLPVRKGLQQLISVYQRAGQSNGFLVSVSNGNVALQNSQIRAFINKGCSVILNIPESATGINAAITASYRAGIPFVTLAGAVTSPYAINVDSNYYLWGHDMAQSIARALGGKGNVVMVKGIEGQPVAVAENQGAESVWKANSGINVVARVNGNWTPSVTKSALLQVLSTHPQKIDAVWTTGSELLQVAQAFEQAHRPVPVITGSPKGDSLAYLHAHPSVNYYGGAVLPSWTAATAFQVAVRLLQGQHPKLNTLLVPIPAVSSKSVNQLWKPCMTTSTVDIFPVIPTDTVPPRRMNGYFSNGKVPLLYNYSVVRKVC